MREIRLYGSEGGGALTGSPYPYRMTARFNSRVRGFTPWRRTGDVRDRPALEWRETKSLASRERERPEGSSRLRSWLA